MTRGPERRRKHWGWGFEDGQLSGDELRALAPFVAEQLGFAASGEVEEPVPVSEVALPAPRIAPPAALSPLCSVDAYARLSHARGKSTPDILEGMRGRFPYAPDVVARPASEEDVEAVLEWAASAGAKVVPYGGGTSVCGGVEPRFEEPAISLDLTALDRVLEVDPVSRAARIQAGASGPRLEEQLSAHAMTLRFYPQSFELATLGGWIATRAGGHFATLWTHIDDVVESVRAITPAGGVWESRRLPGSGAGVSPDRMLLGSEGILGVITEAWVRVQPRPSATHRLTVRFPRFADGAQAVRAIVQARLHPANCRLIEAEEARFTGAGDGSTALLVLAFESVDDGAVPPATDPDPAPAALARARQLAIAYGGTPDEPRVSGEGDDAAGSWRDTFLRAPYLRDSLLQLGVLAETFETAITWDRFDAFVAAVGGSAREALGGAGLVTCRLTHAYQDGAAPYFTVLTPGRRGDEVEQWWAIKRAVSDAILAAGGTITHHHAVGRDHRPWYQEQVPAPYLSALSGAKAAVDPGGVLNPGVLL